MAINAFVSGRAMEKKKRICPQPSISAAPVRSSVMLLAKKERAMIKFQTLNAPGRITPHMVSSSFNSLISRYMGMVPPFKNIVTVKNAMKKLRNGSDLRERA